MPLHSHSSNRTKGPKHKYDEHVARGPLSRLPLYVPMLQTFMPRPQKRPRARPNISPRLLQGNLQAGQHKQIPGYTSARPKNTNHQHTPTSQLIYHDEIPVLATTSPKDTNHQHVPTSRLIYHDGIPILSKLLSQGPQGYLHERFPTFPFI